LSEIFELGPAPDLPVEIMLSARLQQGGLDYSVKIDDPEHIRAAFSGRFPRPFMGDGITGRLEAELKSLRFLESFADIPPLPDLPLTASGNMLVTPDTMDLTGISGSIGQGSFELGGQIGRVPDIQFRNFRFAISGPDWGTLYAAKELQGLPTGFSLSGDIDFYDDLQRLESLQLVLGDSRLEVMGTVDNLPGVSSFDLDVVVDIPELGDFSPFASRFTNIAIPPGPLNADFKLRGSPDHFDLTGVRSGFNASRLDGRLEVSLEDVPTFRGNFDADYIDLSWLVDLDGSAETDNESPDEPVQDGDSNDGNAGRVFSDDPLRLLTFDPIVVDLDFHSDSIIIDTLELSQVDLGLRLTERSLQLSPIRLADTAGRELSGELSLIEDQGRVKASVHGSATGLRLGLTATEDNLISDLPPWDLFVNLDATGATYRELANSTEGMIEIILAEGRVANSRLSLLASDLATELFTRLNPFSRGADFTTVDCGVARVTFDQGRAAISPFVIQTDNVVIVSSGTVDLDSEHVDLGFRTRPRRGLGLSASAIVNPFIKVGGTLSEPGLVLNPTDAAIMSSAAVATGGLSILGQSLFDRFFRERDPCGKIVAELRQAEEGD
jgi:hypothetical protein